MNAAHVVTRFPPSPTGELHLGGARTALFNWLYARRHGGRFIFRIEDTDKQRSTDEATRGIIEAMRWLGLDWDNEVIEHQSRRLERYRQAVAGLVQAGRAYYCHCSPELLERKREKALAEKRKPTYDRTCRELNLGPAPGASVRLRIPLDGATVYEDQVMGSIRIENAEMDDLIILRSDGTPTYHLACVVDDVDMGVTHVIRGQDHVNNTPRQILIYQALDAAIPVFAHVPMIHGSDGQKLSKRHGATSTMAYRDQGYLPEALINYLARLGWSHGDEEIFSRQALVEKFDLGHIGRSPGIFNMEKLNWLNAHYIKETPDADLARALAPFLEERGAKADMARLAGCVALFKPRARTLVEMADQAAFLFTPIKEYDPKGVGKVFTPAAGEILGQLTARLAACPFEPTALEEVFRGMAEERGVKMGEVAQPVRLAVTGRTVSPGLFEILHVLGREETLARLGQAAAFIAGRN